MRVLILHHVTYSINSLCHFFGRRSFATGDESRNLLWLALPSLGEAWHNNHHAFPTSAAHGLRRWRARPLGARDPRAREARPRVGRRAHQPRAPEPQGVRRLMLLARTAPFRAELERCLPERPFGVEFWDGSGFPPPTERAGRASA